MREEARCVIVGGGAMGVGLLYHLAHEGWTDTVLIEKGELTSGSTWHAAGLVPNFIGDLNMAKVHEEAIKLYPKIEEETGLSAGWHGCGAIRFAISDEDVLWHRQVHAQLTQLGIESHIISPAEIKELNPLFENIDDVQTGFYTPHDGWADPTGTTNTMAKGARQLGCEVVRHNRVTDMNQLPDGRWEVITEKGRIVAEHVVNAAGCYAHQVAQMVGLNVPMANALHTYLVTEAVPEFAALETELPVVRDDYLSGYVRQEQDSGLIGIYEQSNAEAAWPDGPDWSLETPLFPEDYDRIGFWLERAMERVPILAGKGIKSVIRGAIAHTPDGEPMLGMSGIPNFWQMVGIQVGIADGPGLGRELARWMVHGAADISMREYDPRRFGDYASKDWQIVKAKEDYCLRHEIPFPHFNRLAGRPVKPSPMYDRLREKGAVFEEVFGHERPRWFAKDRPQEDIYGFGRTELHDIIGEECKAVRERVGIMDITGFTKVELAGPGAEAMLDCMVANRLPKKVGGIALTHILNRRGRIELELTVVKLAEERYYLVCAAFFERRLIDLLTEHAGEGAEIINRSSTWAALTLNGPRARDLLGACTSAPLDNASFRWLSSQEIEIAGHKVFAFRMSYSGELGWEFHGSNEAMLAVYDALWAAGEAHGIADYGSFAMNAMRLEKGFKGAGELTNEVTLPEADVMRFVRMDKDFIGKAETQASLDGDLPWVCAYLSIEPDGKADGNGGEAVLMDGQVVGTTSSVAYGHAVGTILAFAYVKPFTAKPGTELEVVIMGEPRKAKVLAEPAYDPESRLPRTDA